MENEEGSRMEAKADVDEFTGEQLAREEDLHKFKSALLEPGMRVAIVRLPKDHEFRDASGREGILLRKQRVDHADFTKRIKKDQMSLLMAIEKQVGGYSYVEVEKVYDFFGIFGRF